MAPQNKDPLEPVMEPFDEASERSIAAGKVLANPEPGEEIMVTGMAGRFPDSDDVCHFRDNLFNKVDLVSGDNRRWEPGHPEIPQRTGKLNNISKFDAGFFGVHYRQAHSMDPMCRMFLEHAFECIQDAGMHPEELRGSKTGVFIGACFSETEKTWFYDKLEPNSFGITGCVRSAFANRVSYFLGLEGPSYIIDTACSSSLTALEHAYRAIRMGKCDQAIVGGTSLCLHPIVSLQFARLGVLSTDGSCKSFDQDANGYARSESVCAIFLQKAKDARRVYAQLVHAKVNCDGYKEQGITFPSGPMQKRLLLEFYEECNVDPATVDFLEAHATGTKVGDPEEVSAMDQVFCPKRTKPLLVGSVKSNIGHTEPASGLCSVIKILAGMEAGYIPPNIHFKKAREGIEALEQGRMQVVTSKTPWPRNSSVLAGVNSFGFGGANVHVLLRRCSKLKADEGIPRDELPRLVCISGRTEDSIHSILDTFKDKALDAEFIRLLHEVFKNDIAGHSFRGYGIVSKSAELSRDVKEFGGQRRPLCFVFTGPSLKWASIGKQLFAVPLFAASLQKMQNIMSLKGVNITDIIFGNSGSNGHFEDSSNSILGTVCVQVALVDILKTLDVSTDYFIGCSIGEVAAAYADGSLSLEQTVYVAHAIAVSLTGCKRSGGATYEIAFPKNEKTPTIPADIEVVCYNSPNCFTISGNRKTVDSFVGTLKSGDVVVEELKNGSSIRARDCLAIRQKLVEDLKKIMPNPVRRSNKWLSTSIGAHQLDAQVLQLASADYFVHTLLHPSLFVQAASKLPKNAVLLEIGTRFLKPEYLHEIPTDDRLIVHLTNGTDGGLFQGLGHLYAAGFNPKLDRLYPKVQWPVSRGTCMLSPLIKWNHSADWFVTMYKAQDKIKSGESVVSISPKQPDYAFLGGHVVDGRNLYPATGYLDLVFRTFTTMFGMTCSDMQIVFENVRFHRATTFPKEGKLELVVVVQKGTGNFEICEGGTVVVDGRIFTPENIEEELTHLSPLAPYRGKDAINLTKKDIYKELRLRGYNYAGAFRALRECDLEARCGSIEWTGNWITFMDNMLQMKILQEDTRLLYVPTGIERIVVDARTHSKIAEELGEDPAFPCYIYKDSDIIKSGGVEIRGLLASSIARRKALGEPVLETYKFVPNVASLSTFDSVRVNMQILLENSHSIKVRVAELVDVATRPDAAPLGPTIHQVLGDQPLVQPEIVILSKTPIEDVSNATVEDKPLSAESNCSLVVGSNLLQREEVFKQAVGVLKENGFLLSREIVSADTNLALPENHQVLTIHSTDAEKFVFIRKGTEGYKTSCVVDVTDSFERREWLASLQTAFKDDARIIVVAQNDSLSGSLGFVNCLRREPGGTNASLVLTYGNVPEFNVEDSFYREQLEKGLGINVFKDGTWGTYRHLLLEQAPLVESEHCFAYSTVRGDLSSLKWMEGPLNNDTVMELERTLVYVYYCSVNFRDIMTASGRLSVDVITRDRLSQECTQGFEFSGRRKDGRRVMGMIPSGSMATLLAADSYMLWDVPDNWTLEEAATVPVVYGTVYHALLTVGNVKPGQSILIHSGTGGVGQAAINTAFYYQMKVFTTVGNQEKRDFIRKHWPQIPDSHIGNSRDVSFEQMVMAETGGHGVDYVLNSLAEEKLQASVRCLAPGGAFLEIGKFDLASNNALGLERLDDGRSFHGIMLDSFFYMDASVRRELRDLVSGGLANGAIKPLVRTVFKSDEIEQAYRFMATGKHMGKVVVNMRPEEKSKTVVPVVQSMRGIPRYFCVPGETYIICGGLGGFGLELADWLVLRGARKLVLTSRHGLKTGYQALRLKTWKSYGCTIRVSTADITTPDGCAALLTEANRAGKVAAIFNLAVVLKDAILENQTAEQFDASLAPKATATLHLDKASRDLCPDLRDFVVFSSVSCGRGNAGQTNYGMANSIMERICELRKRDGYPAVAVQWGAIGEVGLVAEMQEMQTEIEIGGTLQQRISSCLAVLDSFLRQDEPIVSSMVVAEKRGGAGGANNIVEVVMQVLGLRDLKTISLHSTLPELGMDSMMAIEIKQTLERDFEVFLTAQDIRSMTFARLKEIMEEKEKELASDTKPDEKERLPAGFNVLLRFIGEEENAYTPYYRMESLVKEKQAAPKVFMLPGVEGMGSIFDTLASNLAAHVVALQYCYDNIQDTIQGMAGALLEHVHGNLPKTSGFTFIAHSFGAVVALELVALLEAEGRTGRLIIIDGAPALLQKLAQINLPGSEEEAVLETTALTALMQLYFPLETVLKCTNEIRNCASTEQRIETVLQFRREDHPNSLKYMREACWASMKRIKALMSYRPSFSKLKSTVRLLKPTRQVVEDVADDYELSTYTEDPVEVAVFEGNHLTLLRSSQVAQAINTLLDSGSMPQILKTSILKAAEDVVGSRDRAVAKQV